MRVRIVNFTTKHAPEFGGLITSIIVSITLAVSTSTLYDKAKKQSNSTTYEQQIETLNGVVESINTLKYFVEKQKINLEKSQLTLSELQERQDILKPVIDADQRTVDAIFAIQAQKEHRSVWLERAIGFFLGIAGSLIASLIWAYFKGDKSK